MRGAKGSPYEGGHRVPLFAHWPKGGVTGGRDVPTLTAHIDLLPTMLDLCGLKRPNLGVNLRLHGRSLRPLLLQKKDAPWPERTLVTDSQRLEKLVPWRQAAVMTSQWRLVNASPDGDPNKLELYDILKDPGQKQNVAQSHPQVVNKLKQDYEAWWKQTAQRADQFVRIALGSEVANPVHLSSHDWHGEGGAEKAWNQRQIRQGPIANGFWAVEITRPGLYRIGLRRWPVELNLPIGAAYQDPTPNRETIPGKAIPIVKARLKIGAIDKTVPVAANADKAAVLEVRLPAGPAEMWTWLYGSDNTERGAYYATVERIGA
jgi:hypothetical protein